MRNNPSEEGKRWREKRGKVSWPFVGRADWISVELTSDPTAGPETGSDTHFPFLLPGNSGCGDHMTLSRPAMPVRVMLLQM